MIKPRSSFVLGATLLFEGGRVVFFIKKIGNDLLHLNFLLIPVDCCPAVILSHFSTLSPTCAKD